MSKRHKRNNTKKRSSRRRTSSSSSLFSLSHRFTRKSFDTFQKVLSKQHYLQHMQQIEKTEQQEQQQENHHHNSMEANNVNMEPSPKNTDLQDNMSEDMNIDNDDTVTTTAIAIAKEAKSETVLSPPKLSSSSSSSPSSPKKLSFEEIYQGPATLGKQFEIRWFHSSSSPKNKSNNHYHRNDGAVVDEKGMNTTTIMINHKMPFLRRSLSFIQIGNSISNSSKKNHQQSIHHVHNSNSSGNRSGSNNSSQYISLQRRRMIPYHQILHLQEQQKQQQQCKKKQRYKTKSITPNHHHPIFDILKLDQTINENDNKDNDDDNSENFNSKSKRRKLYNGTKSKDEVTSESATITIDLSQSIFSYRVKQFNTKFSKYATDRITRHTITETINMTKQVEDKETVDDSTLKEKQQQHSFKNNDQQSIQKRKKVKYQLSKHVHKASSFDKSFPPYRPYEKGIWNLPLPNKDAFGLYCERQVGKEWISKLLDHMRPSGSSNELDAIQSISTSNNGNICSSSSLSNNNNNSKMHRQERILLKRMKRQWEKLKLVEKLYWTQEEAWDKARYDHEKFIYDSVKEQGIDVWKDCNSPPNYDLRKRRTRDRGGDDDGNNNIIDEVYMEHGMNNFKKTYRDMYYHYVYYEKNELCVQREWRNDRRCPFCSFDCQSNKGVLIHCKTVHGDTLTFDGGIDEENSFHVLIKSCSNSKLSPLSSSSSKKNIKDFIYVSSKYEGYQKSTNTVQEEDTPICFIPKPMEVTKHLEPAARKRKLKALEQQNEDIHPEARTQYKVKSDDGPIRQYYHSRTMLPITKSEWEKGDDSDDEDDDHWIRQLGERLMDELDDVSSNEKLFMNIWNRYMKTHHIISDASIPDRCREFIVTHHKDISKHALRDHLVLHFFNLWDNGILTSSKILDLMNLYDEKNNCESNKAKAATKTIMQKIPKAGMDDDGSNGEEKKSSD